jgi:hypothetical protein
MTRHYSGPVTIHAVGSDAIPEFLAVADRVNASDPRWVPPLRQQLAFELGGPCEMSKYGRWQMFLADDGWGRIAAIVNPRLTGASGAPLGQLGYFECADDTTLATALFDAGAAWLRAQGCRELLGPMNGGAHRLHRLLVRGFAEDPFLFEPRNPAYYPRLFEAWGMRVVHRWFTYELAADKIDELGRRFGRVVDARPLHGALVIGNPGDAGDTLARLHRLLDDFWTGHIGYASLSLAEFAEAFAGALAVMTQRNLCIYNEDGRDLGCAFMYADFVAEARQLAGDASGWARWMAGPMPKRMIMHTLALRPEARTSTVPLALMEAGCLKLREDGFDTLLVALVVEGLLGKQLGPATREYALYGKTIER